MSGKHYVLSSCELIRIYRRKQQSLELSDLPARPCPHLSFPLNFLCSVFLCLDTSASSGARCSHLRLDEGSPLFIQVPCTLAASKRLLSVLVAHFMLLLFFLVCIASVQVVSYEVAVAFFKVKSKRSVYVLYRCTLSTSEAFTQCLLLHWYM